MNELNKRNLNNFNNKETKICKENMQVLLRDHFKSWGNEEQNMHLIWRILRIFGTAAYSELKREFSEHPLSYF
jgi:hypothetical protein